MKKLIKKILKESVDNRIIDILIKLKLTNYNEIYNFLHETGYDRNEIKEIYSIYFESVSGMDLTPSNWMNYYFSPDQLEMVIPNEHLPGLILFNKDGKSVMNQDTEFKYFWFSYGEICSFFKLVLGMSTEETEEFLNYWLENTLKLKGYKVKII